MMELETFFTVPQQIRLLLYAVFLGFPLGFCFDLLRSIRAILPHGKLAAALEDIAFLLLWSGALVCFSCVLARGEIRGYYVLGSILGFLLYCCTLGVLIVPLLRRILHRIFRCGKWAFRPILHGIVRITGVLKEKFGHFAKLFQMPLFFSHLPLNRERKMLYNKKDQTKQEVTRKWLRRKRNRKKSHAGSFGSSAGPQ
ncbi:spore cortex biosynthesis protein YabQ [uncultured Ruminococcus sp.]|uniref:spore cortex biosynthesis protein YabQ n=1 Tax=uncultured Ruminococcus sp. TaxID=165186 RepID=UPI0025D7E46F|nr:spore cortex biosynthesis protein YabQ [uncultured Ruminococcus sp.]